MMRKVNVVSQYSRYVNAVYRRQMSSPVVLRQMAKSVIAPGCVLHDHPRRDRVFNNRIKLGNAAWRLYWRLHPDQLNKAIGRK